MDSLSSSMFFYSTLTLPSSTTSTTQNNKKNLGYIQQFRSFPTAALAICNQIMMSCNLVIFFRKTNNNINFHRLRTLKKMKRKYKKSVIKHPNTWTLKSCTAFKKKTRLKITSVITRVHKSISIRTQGSKLQCL
jgi:hypothetical protein